MTLYNLLCVFNRNIPVVVLEYGHIILKRLSGDLLDAWGVSENKEVYDAEVGEINLVNNYLEVIV